MRGLAKPQISCSNICALQPKQPYPSWKLAVTILNASKRWWLFCYYLFLYGSVTWQTNKKATSIFLSILQGMALTKNEVWNGCLCFSHSVQSVKKRQPYKQQQHQQQKNHSTQNKATTGGLLQTCMQFSSLWSEMTSKNRCYSQK